MLTSYFSEVGEVYSSNSVGWTLNGSPIKQACYVPPEVVAKSIQLKGKGVPCEKIFAVCVQKIHLDLPEGYILYEDSSGNLKSSRVITRRDPPFKSLDRRVLSWLGEVTPEDEPPERYKDITPKKEKLSSSPSQSKINVNNAPRLPVPPKK